MALPQRVAVVGNSGSGKSTLARDLARRLDAVPPRIAAEPMLEVHGARHPLLQVQHDYLALFKGKQRQGRAQAQQ